MIGELLEILNFVEAIGVVCGVLAAAYLFWLLGIRQPFLLTLLALLIGGPLGWLAERALGRAIRRLLRGKRAA